MWRQSLNLQSIRASQFTEGDIPACLLDTLAAVVDVETPDREDHAMLGHCMDGDHIFRVHLSQDQDIAAIQVLSFAMLPHSLLLEWRRHLQNNQQTDNWNSVQCTAFNGDEGRRANSNQIGAKYIVKCGLNLYHVESSLCFECRDSRVKNLRQMCRTYRKYFEVISTIAWRKKWRELITVRHYKYWTFIAKPRSGDSQSIEWKKLFVLKSKSRRKFNGNNYSICLCQYIFIDHSQIERENGSNKQLIKNDISDQLMVFLFEVTKWQNVNFKQCNSLSVSTSTFPVSISWSWPTRRRKQKFHFVLCRYERSDKITLTFFSFHSDDVAANN